MEREIEQLKLKINETRKNQDEMFHIQSETLRKLNEVHHCLLGTEYEQNNGGGLVRKVGKLEKLCDTFNIWMEKTKTRNAIIYTLITALLGFISTVIIANWQNIFS